MPWARYSDQFSEDPAWDGLDGDAFRAYFRVVEICCRTKRVDGRLPLDLALSAARTADPMAQLQALQNARWLSIDDDTVDLPRIKEHVPTDAMIRESEQSAARMAAYRAERKAHGLGDHSTCKPHRCDHVQANVQANVQASRTRPEPVPEGETVGRERGGIRRSLRGSSAPSSTLPEHEDLRRYLEQRPERFTEQEIAGAIKRTRGKQGIVKNLPRLAVREANRIRHGRNWDSGRTRTKKQKANTEVVYRIGGTPIPRSTR